MLAEAYPFYHIMDERVERDGHIKTLLYRFKSTKSNMTYIVLVEHYVYDVFAVKFYPKSWADSPNKYRKLTNTFEPRKIIYTCINIMLSIYEQYPNASFGFVGANRINETTVETKRYKVYSTIIATYFSSRLFYHKENKDKSAYLLINNVSLRENPLLIREIERFFSHQYRFD
jgi:hypothetical protein